MAHRVRHILEILILLAILLFTVGAVSHEPVVANWPAHQGESRS